MSSVISVSSLGKKYVLNHQDSVRYTALRDVIANSVRNGFSRLIGKNEETNQANFKEDFWALHDVSFEVNQGDRIGIIGRNGAGKSTLLKVLSRITEPTTGNVRIKGRVASLLEVGTGFHPELTGRENIYLNGAILGMSKREIQSKFDEIVSFAEIERFLDTPVKRYSSGMYVRLAFAVAAHLEPEILIVDEVLAVGDAQFQKKCMGKMEDVGQDGRTVLFVSHNMGAIHALCNRCLLLEGGKLVDDGDTLKLISRYNASDRKVDIVEITPKMRNRGNGAIELINCALADVDGRPRNSFHIGEDVVVRFRFTSNFTGPMSFWLIIFDEAGNPLLSTHQRDKELVNIVPGAYQLTYRTTNFGLMPGHYSIAAGAFDTDLNFLEWIDACQNFEVYSSFVNGSSFDGRWGRLNQTATWRIEAMQ